MVASTMFAVHVAKVCRLCSTMLCLHGAFNRVCPLVWSSLLGWGCGWEGSSCSLLRILSRLLVLLCLPVWRWSPRVCFHGPTTPLIQRGDVRSVVMLLLLTGRTVAECRAAVAADVCAQRSGCCGGGTIPCTVVVTTAVGRAMAGKGGLARMVVTVEGIEQVGRWRSRRRAEEGQ